MSVSRAFGFFFPQAMADGSVMVIWDKVRKGGPNYPPLSFICLEKVIIII